MGSFPVIGAHSAAYLSALGLISIQVCIGIILKSSQTDGLYAFSVSGSVTISEFFKCLLSATFMIRECLAKRSNKERAYSLLPSSPRRSEDEEDLCIHDDELRDMEEEKRSEIWICAVGALYALINNTLFVAYKLADLGTIVLTRSGVIFITAVVVVVSLENKISKMQWLAVLIQLCGLITTQYRPGTGISYPIITYLVLMGLVFISSVSGVYNEALLKRDKASLHAQNTVLYAAGTIINILIHATVRAIKVAEPSFFVGYTTLSACLVITSYIFIGIAITAVHKYANAVVKCLASTVANGILLYVSPFLFGTEMTPLTVPGGLIIFISSLLYMDSPPPKEAVVSESEEDDRPEEKLQPPPTSRSIWYKIFVLVISTAATIAIIASVEVTDFTNISKTELTSTITSIDNTPGVVKSPFSSTIAFIRFNANRPERLDYMEKYRPFFAELHYSMPDFTDGDPEFVNTTHDGWENQLVA